MNALHNQNYTAGNSAKLMKPAAGASDDWAKSRGVKYSYTIELRDTGFHGFNLPPKFIVPTAKEALAFVHTVSQAVARSSGVMTAGFNLHMSIFMLAFVFLLAKVCV